MSENPPYNESHPPFATSIDALIPTPTQLGIIGICEVTKDNFDYVIDPAYPWQEMPTVTPKERERREAVRQEKLEQVEKYILTRGRYWQRTDEIQFAEDREMQVTITVGIETTHQETASRTSTETIGLTLGLDLSGDLFSSGAAKKAAAFRKSEGVLKGGKASSSAEFTYMISEELRFEQTDIRTYREETTISTTETYRGGAVYYVWVKSEELSIARMRPGAKAPEHVKQIVAGTGKSWTDRFIYRPDDDENDDAATGGNR
ncbi:hypothetical protein IC614_02660 [Allosphingosinicella flava]|uniref:Uncharacterized protein n=1 Tax=Allosphingosinicella flava TaxID=2771430 RepID=A0A7T2LMQ8_9SPHN|nr:hypothetical protein [Sphingosinicella flava]QPQ55523.1 hypothetical protein IC614_02660 [Sphingosinicella flava]